MSRRTIAPVAGRRPKFRDRVLCNGTYHRLVAMVVAPMRGYIIRPEGAPDAATDILLSREEWAAFQWSSRREQWGQS